MSDEYYDAPKEDIGRLSAKAPRGNLNPPSPFGALGGTITTNPTAGRATTAMDDLQERMRTTTAMLDQNKQRLHSIAERLFGPQPIPDPVAADNSPGVLQSMLCESDYQRHILTDIEDIIGRLEQAL